MTDSLRLLADYAANGSEEAFRQVVTNYVDLVYSTAVRLVDGDRDRAKDVAQEVFVDLARLGGKLSSQVMLGGWLHRHTCFVASKTMRRERRRQNRERQAAEMSGLEDHYEARFDDVAPVLDEAINQLSAPDRSAIVLRFFEGQDLRTVGRTLATTEDAARKRVGRALEKLRVLLRRRGVALSGAGLASLLATDAVTAAPAGLAGVLADASLVAAASATTGAGFALGTATATATKAIARITLPKAIVGTMLAVAVGAGIYQARETSSLRTQLQTLEQQQGPLTEQIGQLTRKRDEAARSLTGLREALRMSTDNRDLLRLRAEAARLRSTIESARQSAKGSSDPVAGVVESWIAGLNRIRAAVERTPEAVIPEFRLLGDADWWNAAKHIAAGMDEREVLNGMRFSAENALVQLVQPALQKYLQTHNSQFPTDLAQLRPYFKSPVDDAVLERWQIVPASEFPGILSQGSDREATHVVTQRVPSPIDEADDRRWLIQPNGLTLTGFKPIPK